MTEFETRKRCACFTGHRPEKLTFSEESVRAWLREVITDEMEKGRTAFISGMSQGVDIWAAEEVLTIRKSGKAIRLISAGPYEGYEEDWSRDWAERYRRVMDQADLVTFLCPRYRPGCFEYQNRWMVDRSSVVLAVYNGRDGGTKDAIDYARRAGVDVRFFPLEANVP